MVAKRHRVTPVSKRQRRTSIKRGQLKIRKKTLEVKRAISTRGRQHLMEAPSPGQPLQPQDVLTHSSAIKRFRYNIEKKILRIWWVPGGVYDYFNVPESVVLNFAQASSKGRFAYYNIRTSFKYKRVNDNNKKGVLMTKKKKGVKPLPKMTVKRRSKIEKSYAKYNRKYFSTSTPKRKRKR